MRHALFLLPFLAVALPAHAAEQISISYRLDVTSVTMMTAKFDLDFSPDAVRAKARIKNKGISELFSQYSAKVMIESKIRDAEIRPAQFHLTREKRDRTKETLVSWNDGGKVSVDPPAHRKAEVRAKVEQALTGDVADPITAILRVGSSGANPCPSVQLAFDGQNVFQLTFRDLGKGEAEAGSYRGPVQNCEVRWSPIAGSSAEKGEPGEDYRVAFAPAGTLPSGKTLWLPVSLTGSIKGLPFEATVTKLDTGSGKAAQAPAQD
ncbi:DUF3108 domain-containing protein [Aestuariivirga sp.]|uniref:DUF3108 domain-containing protein n=1 Tax=Aestuariivirga sp. TaxID=2650926 RepID=UPI00391BD777